MLGHNSEQVPASLFEGFKKDNYSDEVSDEVIEEFRGALIADYERALESGLTPIRALAVVLSWAASESERLG